MSLRALKQWNAHLVLASKKKRALAEKWQEASADLDAAQQHRASGGLIGIVPGPSGIAVIDVDEGDPTELIKDWPPLAQVDTPSGGVHLLYCRPDSTRVGNSKFDAYGCKGDIRCDAGYLIIWNDKQWLKAIVEVSEGDGIFVNPFPTNVIDKQKGDAPITPGARLTKVAVTPDMARAYLAGIDPDVVYEDWIRVGQALHDAFSGSKVGLEVWDEWSARGQKYDNKCTYHWNTFTVGGGVSWGTIVNMSNGREVAQKKPEYGDFGRPVSVLLDEGGQDPNTLLDVLGRLGVQLRFNLRSGYTEITRPNSQLFRRFTDHTEAGLFWMIEDRFTVPTKNGEKPLRFVMARRKDCIHALLDREAFRVDPFLAYLENDTPEWDGVDRIDHWLSDLLGAEDDSLARWASAYPFIGAVQRSYEPGSKIDELPVLIGDEGIGKSAALKSLVPPFDPTLFGDHLALDDTPQKQVEATLGRVLIEIAELVGMTRALGTKLKAFISRQDDGGLRLAYGHGPEPRPRMFVMVGTTNDEQVLPAYEKHNRRWVPIMLGESSGAAEEFFDAKTDGHTVRSMMWAEALEAYRGGRRAGLPRALKPEQKAAAERHRWRDDVADEMLQKVSGVPQPLSQVCQDMGLDPKNKADQAMARNALRSNGWNYVNKLVTMPNKDRKRLWHPPKDWDDREW